MPGTTRSISTAWPPSVLYRTRPPAHERKPAGFRLGDGWVVSAGRFLVAYAVSITLVLAGTASFILTLGQVLHGQGIATADGPVTEWFVNHRCGFATSVLQGFAFVFGPFALPVITLLVTASWALLTRCLWRPLLLAGAMVSGVILTEVIAHVVGRSRPPSTLMMLGGDPTSSFPSGHVVGASNFLLVGAYLVSSRSRAVSAAAAFSAAAAGATLEAASRIYLGYHWFTDTLASAAISLVILAVVIALDVSRGKQAEAEQTT